MWRLFLILLGTLTFLPRVWAEQPAEGVLWASRDIQRVPHADRYVSRYLWCEHITSDAEGLRLYSVIAAHVNFLSRTARISPPTAIFIDEKGVVTTARWPFTGRSFWTGKGPNWKNLKLIRLRISDYGWEQLVDSNGVNVFDRLGDPTVEFFFHSRKIAVLYPAGKYKDGRSYPAGEELVPALAPWLLDPLGGEGYTWLLPKEIAPPIPTKDIYAKALLDLIRETGYSRVPILEARNFIWQTAIQFDRPIGYSDFLGVKDKKTFDKMVGFDEKASIAFAYPQLEAVASSGVTTQPRRIEIWRKLDGKYVLTKDQVNQRALKNRNPLLTLGLNDLEFDATEIFAQLPNGLWATGLFNNKGVRQDSAPDGVGYFHSSLTNDGKIHVYLTCLACHDAKDKQGGIQPFRPYFRNLYIEPGPLSLGVTRIKGSQELTDEYLTPIDLEGDQRRYEKSLYQACGLRPNEYARALYDTFNEWDKPVDRVRAARLHGVTEKVLVDSILRYVREYGAVDEVNGNWVLNNPTTINIDQFAESYSQGQLILRNIPRWADDHKRRYPTRPR